MFRFLGILLLAALCAGLLITACVSACGVAFVSVIAEDGPKIIAPVPLIVPLTALRVAPERILEEAGESLEGLPAHALAALGPFLEVLAEGDEDAVLAEIEERESLVRIVREGDELVLQVREGPEAEGTRVAVRWPIRSLTEAAAACSTESGPDGSTEEIRCDLRQVAYGLLRAARGGEVEVRAPEGRVDISIW